MWWILPFRWNVEAPWIQKYWRRQTDTKTCLLEVSIFLKKKTLRKIENVCLVVKKPHEGETNERVCKKISENSCTLICFEVGLSELSRRNGAEKQPHCYSINVSADYGPKQLQLKIHLTFYLKELLKKVDSILERKIRNNTTLKNASPLSFWITRCIIFYYG